MNIGIAQEKTKRQKGDKARCVRMLDVFLGAMVDFVKLSSWYVINFALFLFI